MIVKMDTSQVFLASFSVIAIRLTSAIFSFPTIIPNLMIFSYNYLSWELSNIFNLFLLIIEPQRTCQVPLMEGCMNPFLLYSTKSLLNLNDPTRRQKMFILYKFVLFKKYLKDFFLLAKTSFKFM